MDQSLLKSCLENEFYNDNKAKLRSSLFDETVKEIFDTIVFMHEKFSRDIKPVELFSYWKSQHPTSTSAWSVEIEETITDGLTD